MTKEELEKEAEVFVSEKADKGNFDVEKFGKAYFSESSMKQALVKFAEPREKEIEILGERCLQLQKDKGELTDRVRELESQIEKMKCCKNCSKDCGSIDRRICFENKMKDWELKK